MSQETPTPECSICGKQMVFRGSFMDWFGTPYEKFECPNHAIKIQFPSFNEVFYLDHIDAEFLGDEEKNV